MRFVLLLLTLLLGQQAKAACTTPQAGVAGQFKYISGDYQYCNGTAWVSMKYGGVSQAAYLQQSYASGLANLAGVAVYGNYAYIIGTDSVGAFGIQTFDISNASAATQASYNTFSGGTPIKIVTDGSYLYVTTNANELKIFSIAAPTTPSSVGTLTYAGLSTSQRTKIVGNYFYVTLGNSLVIFDVTTRTAPAFSGIVTHATTLLDAFGLEVSGNYAYVATYQTSIISVIDISNKAAPSIVGSVSLGPNQYTYDLVLAGNYIYAPDAGGSNNPISLVDVTVKTSPVDLGGLSSPLGVGTAIKVGNYVYGSGSFGAFHTIDATNPASPTLALTSTLGFGSNLKFSAQGNRLVALINGGFSIVDLSITTSIVGSPEVAVKTSGSSTSAVYSYVSGTTAVTLDTSMNYYFFDVSNPAAMTAIASSRLPISTNSYSPCGTGTGTYLIVCGINQGSLYFVNFSTPTASSVVKTVGSLYPMYAIVTDSTGNYVFSASTQGLQVVDKTSIPSAALVGTVLKTMSYPTSVYVSGNYAYVTDSSGNALHIFDITTKTAPTFVATYTGSINGVTGVTITASGNYAYAVGSGYVTVIDVTTKSSPTYVTQVTTGLSNSQRVSISGSYLYAGGSNFTSYDIAAPAAPVYRSTVALPAIAQGISISGTNAFVGTTGGSTVMAAVNITTPTALTFTSSVGMVGDYDNVTDSSEIGNYSLAISPTATKLTITNLTTPSSPTISSTLVDATRFGGAVSVDAESTSYAYVLSSAYFSVVNISTPTAPVVSGSINDATNFASPIEVVAPGGSYAYALTAGKFVVINVVTKSAPVISTAFTHADLSGCRDLYISGSYAYAACSTSQKAVIIDISTPTAPTVVGTFSNSRLASADGIAVIGNVMYVQASSYIMAIDVTTKASPVLLSETYSYSASRLRVVGSAVLSGYYNGNNTSTVVGAGNQVTTLQYDVKNSYGGGASKFDVTASRFVAYTFNSIFVHTISAVPAPLQSASAKSINGELTGLSSVLASGSYAYAVAQGKLTVIDISTPAAPTLTGYVLAPDINGNAMAKSGNYVYIASGGSLGRSVSVVNVATPSAPTFVRSIDGWPSLQSVDSMVVVGSRIWVSGYYYVSSIDISSPSNPVLGANIAVGTGIGLAISGSYAYTCDNTNLELNIVDISNPASLTQTTYGDAANLAGCYDVAVSGSYLYAIVRGASKLLIYNISTPTAPTLVGSVAASSLANALRVSVSGNYATVTASDGKVSVFDVTTKSAPVLNDSGVNSATYAVGSSFASPYAYTTTFGGLVVMRANPIVTQGSCSVAGQLKYNTTNNVLTYCNGSVYLPSGISPGTGGAGCSTPTGAIGATQYRSSSNKLEYCDGTTWRPIN